jgi:hypothetical protein
LIIGGLDDVGIGGLDDVGIGGFDGAINLIMKYDNNII